MHACKSQEGFFVSLLTVFFGMILDSSDRFLGFLGVGFWYISLAIVCNSLPLALGMSVLNSMLQGQSF